MTAGELRTIMKDTPDNVEVVIFLPENVKPGAPDYMRYVQTATDVGRSSISDRELKLTAGSFFGY